jgi:hypothetical protein
MTNPKCQTGPTFDTFDAKSADSTGLFLMLITRAVSFDHLVSAGKQRRRHREPDQPRRLGWMTNSNLSDCTTGKTATLSPLRIRPV